MTDTPNRSPLWRALKVADASWTSDLTIPEARAIIAVRNWLKMELPEGGAWYVLLTAEAERAERG